MGQASDLPSKLQIADEPSQAEDVLCSLYSTFSSTAQALKNKRMNPGSVVRCRSRNSILLPTESDDTLVPRPLTGTRDDVVKIPRELADLVGDDLPLEQVVPPSFPLPTLDDVSGAAGAHLL